MSSPVESLTSEINATDAFGIVTRFLRQKIHQQLSQIHGGRIHLVDGLGSVMLGNDESVTGIHVRLNIRSPEFYRQVALNGSVGAGESYMDSLWHCDDLVGLIRLLAINRDLLDGMESGTAKIGGWLMKAAHAFTRNTRAGSKKNIAAHYDLGNDFFKLFLCNNMMYSSAIFAKEDDTLELASDRKLERICQKLDLKPTDHLIEIGTGWGGMALYAAKHYGCKVTTTTISKEQHALASQRIAEAGLSDRVTLLLNDYRDLEGSYDKLVSIEMIEAIGHQYLDTYMAKCTSLLKPDGLALIQAITIEDHRYEQALHSVDFIKRYIFPGSFIPCVSVMVNAAAQSGPLRLLNLEDIGPSYARTLHEWRRRFMSQLENVRLLGYDDRFIKMWEFYLAYCEGAFIERSISDVHLLFARSLNKRVEFLPSMTNVQ
ncbi:MAG: cyclopropane-fatty-acyl-phospholipid synthase family protein [Arenimonas sp.]